MAHIGRTSFSPFIRSVVCQTKNNPSVMMWKQKLSTDTKDFWVDYQVERLANCTPLEFCKKAYSRYHPVILTGLIDHWPALNKWNEDYFHELLDDKPISVNLTPDGRADSVQSVDYEGVRGDYFVYPAEVQMTMKEFFHLFHLKDEIVPYLSQQNDNLRREFHELLVDMDLDLPLAELFESKEPEAVNLWIGDERSVSSIHKDHFENFYAVISGEKTFTLMPPTDIAFLPELTYPALKYEATFSHEDGEEGEGKISGLRLTKDGCPADMLSWISVDPDDESTHSSWSDKHLCNPIRCTVRAGEILYIPAMWYHRVSQNCMTIAVNMWYDQRFDFRYVFYEHISDRKHNLSEKDALND